MKIYDDGVEPLHEILKAASSDQGATLLIPDLQRPYVWSPEQVTLLVDSLLRGWPFGTLLLWSVQNEALASIPSRPFWRVVDRTEVSDAAQISRSNPPAQFRMVLDGQQRLQSLLLAFGGDSWGFRLPDHEWSIVLDSERPCGRNARQHWSLGHLCLDLLAFRARFKSVQNITKVDFRDVLSWVVQDPNGGRSVLKRPGNYKYPVSSCLEKENIGRYVRLSRLWDLASIQAGLFEKHYREKIKPLLRSHNVKTDVIDDVLEPLSELMVTLVSVKLSKVSYLQLSAFDADVLDQDVYNDAIVNIFTRLNTAGRTLTRQEITFAWIKTGWDAKQTDGRTADRCFESLRASLRDEQVKVDIDGLVGVVSAMWSVLFRKGELLTAKDLLRGEKVSPMARDLVKVWNAVAENVIGGVQLVKLRSFQFGMHYRSLNVLTLLLSWRLIGRQWLAENALPVTERDSFEKSLDALFSKSCDRWIVMSQWSRRWAKSTDKVFAEYITDLADARSKIGDANDPSEVINVLRLVMETWIEALKVEASKYIDDLAVQTREAVHQYYLPLWLWHRLDVDRWNASSISLRSSKRAALSLEVDHVVSVKLWQNVLPENREGNGESEETPLKEDVAGVMNSLGNCFLLEKSFNISKGAEPLKSFLSRVHEFVNREVDAEVWADALALEATMVDPISSNAVKIREAVEARAFAMKEELKRYVEGEVERVDV